MSIQQILQQLLQSGQSLAKDAGSQLGGAGGGSALGGFGGGALTGGALGLLLGNKKFRKMGGKVAAYGGAAALGAIALKAYQDCQNNNAAAAAGSTPAVPESVPTPAPQAALPGPGIEHESRAVLAAMIAAAKADGHVGAQERQLIDTEIARLGHSAADVKWFEAELAKPANPAEIAALAATPEMAAEIYLASLLVVDEDSFMERAYLEELARELKLDPALKAQLHAKLAELPA
jgi:uncharacterized membrane protein YebE (DUF533 family)